MSYNNAPRYAAPSLTLADIAASIPVFPEWTLSRKPIAGVWTLSRKAIAGVRDEQVPEFILYRARGLES